MLVLVPVAIAALMLSGCTSAPTASMPASGMSAATPAVAESATANAASSAQLCAVCGGLGEPTEALGTATMDNGTQVVSIKIVGGYYVPNKVTVKAGMPVKVVFSGFAKGCVAKPTFKSLGKATDVTATGIGTIELGALTAGTYGFTCSMGANPGSIVVQ
jgi:plastocyanin